MEPVIVCGNNSLRITSMLQNEYIACNPIESRKLLSRYPYCEVLVFFVRDAFDGIDNVVGVRENGFMGRVLLLTSDELTASEQAALYRAGIDNYLPASMAEIILPAMIRSCWRAIENKFVRKIYRVGNLTINIDLIQAFVDERPVHFPKSIYNALVHFIKNLDEVMTRKRMLDLLWEDEDVNELAVDSKVKMLRKYLEKYRVTGFTIETHHGFGYRAVATE